MTTDQIIDTVTTVVTVATMAAPLFGSAKIVENLGIIGRVWMFLAGNFGHAKNKG